MKIAIIGAGLSGCNLYNMLCKLDNIKITIFDKSRGTGGRCSTKYIGDKFIDHGTAYINPKTRKLEEFLISKEEQGMLLRLSNNSFIPTKGINKICSSLINKNDLVRNSKIQKCTFSNNKWQLQDENSSYEDFDFLFITIPSKQVLELDIELDNQTKNLLESVSYTSIASLVCYSYKNKKIDLDKLNKSDIFHKTIDNSKKYKYEKFSSYVLHFSYNFIKKYEDLTKDKLFEVIHKNLKEEFDLDIKKDFKTVEHFWKYAFVKDCIDDNYLFDENRNLGFCADYFKGYSLQGAYASSRTLSKKIKEILC